jgi:hypothetical protein
MPSPAGEKEKEKERRYIIARWVPRMQFNMGNELLNFA